MPRVCACSPIAASSGLSIRRGYPTTARCNADGNSAEGKQRHPLSSSAFSWYRRGDMHIFVAGGAGYIGSVLVPELLTQGHRVTVLDRLYFGDTLAKTQNRFGHHLAVVRGDLRKFDASLLGGVDAVVDLSGISNDPSCELEPELTMSVNVAGAKRLA